MGPQATLLSDGARLHLHHGPIDLIIGVDPAVRQACFARATARFQTLLDALVTELPLLRRPLAAMPKGPVARRMARAVLPHRDVFVTPMAAVAGAVADEVLAEMVAVGGVRKAYVNNGGDIAFHIEGAATFTAMGAAGEIKLGPAQPARGIATSGWRGRSHSLGIADAVTVLARTAAEADVAATLIANAVDVPGHPEIARVPATDVACESDLGERLITADVGRLNPGEVAEALARGVETAKAMCANGMIESAVLLLAGETRVVAREAAQTKGRYVDA